MSCAQYTALSQRIEFSQPSRNVLCTGGVSHKSTCQLQPVPRSYPAVQSLAFCIILLFFLSFIPPHPPPPTSMDPPAYPSLQSNPVAQSVAPFLHHFTFLPVSQPPSLAAWSVAPILNQFTFPPVLQPPGGPSLYPNAPPLSPTPSPPTPPHPRTSKSLPLNPTLRLGLQLHFYIVSLFLLSL